jgi:hypothetical protein
VESPVEGKRRMQEKTVGKNSQGKRESVREVLGVGFSSLRSSGGGFGLRRMYVPVLPKRLDISVLIISSE